MNKKYKDERGLILYFAYGSNMNPQRMKERDVIFYSRQHFILDGYSLKFNKIVKTPNAGAANIIPNEKSVVEGVLYEISWQGILNLDKFELYQSEYDRIVIDYKDDIEILSYVAYSHKTREGLRPLRSYKQHLLAAKDILSKNYYTQLEAVETLD